MEDVATDMAGTSSRSWTTKGLHKQDGLVRSNIWRQEAIIPVKTKLSHSYPSRLGQNGRQRHRCANTQLSGHYIEFLVGNGGSTTVLIYQQDFLEPIHHLCLQTLPDGQACAHLPLTVVFPHHTHLTLFPNSHCSHWAAPQH